MAAQVRIGQIGIHVAPPVTVRIGQIGIHIAAGVLLQGVFMTNVGGVTVPLSLVGIGVGNNPVPIFFRGVNLSGVPVDPNTGTGVVVAAGDFAFADQGDGTFLVGSGFTPTDNGDGTVNLLLPAGWTYADNGNGTQTITGP